MFRYEFLTNNLERYSGARLFSDLCMVVAVSLVIISLIVGQFRMGINGVVGEQKLPLVTILAARFCKF